MPVRLPGETAYFVAEVVDGAMPANNPVTGQTVTVALRRESDDTWWNWTDEVWDSPGTYVSWDAGEITDHKQALTDLDNGAYSASLVQDGTTASYVAIYEVAAGAYQGMAQERWEFGTARPTQVYRPGVAAVLQLAIVDPPPSANNPVAGESPTVALYALSDGTYYDFVAGTWGVVADYASLAAGNLQALADNDDGTYDYTWTTRATEDTILAIYEIPGGSGYQGMIYEVLHLANDVVADPGLCTVYFDHVQGEGGAVGDAGDAKLNVVEVLTKPSGVDMVYGWGTAAAVSDTSGRVSINIPQGAVVVVDADWPGRRAPLRLTITVPVASEYDIGDLLQS